jgi:type II secretory pathway component PulK
MAALWLVVAIAAVALQFSLEARERRTIGILASERGIQRAAAMGALSLVQARLDQAIRVAPSGTNPNIARLGASDAWYGVDSAYTGTVFVDSMQVYVEAHDLGEKLNINQLSENDLQTFFSFLLSDYSKATQLAQAIMDWRDADSIPRPSGAERDAYIKAEMLALPTNAPFREVEELQDVMGMTPEIYAKARPYFTTKGNGQVNVNTAPVPVLRALPGMNDQTLNMILQLRSQGRRINNINDVFAAQRSRQAGGPAATPTQMVMAARVTTTVNVVELTITARTGPQAPPSKLTAIVQKNGGNRPNDSANITSKQW